MRQLLLFFSLIFISTVCAVEKLVVHLHPGKGAQKVYLEGSFPEHLLATFRSDISLNGGIELSEALPLADYIFDYKRDQNQHTFSLKEKNGRLIRSTEFKELTKKQIHLAADFLFESLFSMKGICSKHLYFTWQTSINGDWQSKICRCDIEGRDVSILTPDNEYSLTPASFRKGGEFYFVSYKYGQPKIFFSKGEKEPKPCIELRGSQILPSLSYDGSILAFISDICGRADLFIQYLGASKEPIGKPLQLSNLPQSIQASPSISPDNRFIAFVSDKDRTPRVYYIPLPERGKAAKKEEMICISTQFGEATCPSWSPDGKKIAYSAKIGSHRQIVIYDVALHQNEVLTTGDVHKENPVWAENSMHLLYNTAEASDGELFIIHLQQKKPVRISIGLGRKHFPAWGI